MGLILTVPPLAEFAPAARHDAVEAVRINSTHDVRGDLTDVLRQVRRNAGGKPVWIDLKTRQLRITDYRVEFQRDHEVHFIGLSHPIRVDLPTKIYVDNGQYTAQVTEVVGSRTLIIPSSTEKKQGLPLPAQGQVGLRPGMSVNIPSASTVDDFLTPKDKQYITAARTAGIHTYMLSYVENADDIADLRKLDRKANIIAKIESPGGLDYVADQYDQKARIHLMAARGDLYTELSNPEDIIAACQDIIEADPQAVFASRMFESLKSGPPSCGDLFDVVAAMQMGYERFLLGDDIGAHGPTLTAAIELYDKLRKQVKP